MCVCTCVSSQVLDFFRDHWVPSDRSSRCYRRQVEPHLGPWRVRLSVAHLSPSKRLPLPPMHVPVQRTRRFRGVFDLWRCRRRLLPSSVVPATGADSRGPSRLLEDVDQRAPDATGDQAPPEAGPLIVVKHFCKVDCKIVLRLFTCFIKRFYFSHH